MKNNQKIMVVAGVAIVCVFLAYLFIHPLNMLYVQAVTFRGATHMYDEATPEALNPDPETFRFENYAKLGKQVLGTALSCMFPVGTKKEYVDRILIEKAGARYERTLIPASIDPNARVSHGYFYTMPWGLHYFASTEQKVSLYYKNGRSIYDVSLSGLGESKCKKDKK